jgi:mono/diheme cytochrome c family protein
MNFAAPRCMAVTLAILLSVAASSGTGAEPQPKPFAAGDAVAGEAIASKDCVGCHAGRFGGDPDRIYTRAERKVRSPAQLLARVQVCNVELGKHYFPEDEEHVAAYLNLHYYKFKP